MKKLFISTLMMLLTLAAGAQTKISAQLQEGATFTYTEQATIALPGQSEYHLNSETEYKVNNVTAEGAVITVTMKTFENDIPETDMAGQMMSMMAGVHKNVGVRLQVDADGKVVAIQNFEEVKNLLANTAADMVDMMANSNPTLAGMKDAILAQIMEQASEEALVEKYSKGGVLGLNGKTLANGATDTYTVQGLKMKSMYFVTARSIIVNSQLDMTTDDLKAFVIAQVEQQMPDQAAMIRENIDMVMGQMHFEMTSRSTYTMQDNGWPRSISTETNQDMMGQSIRQASTITLKE
ncbi:MAG: hypothetical protein IJT98_04815 [Prevotella sp.]|nr:hypothetical protein [Prevotella sp.]